MAISFEESKKRMEKLMCDSSPVASLRQAEAAPFVETEGNFQKDLRGKYDWYDSYYDTDFSVVDKMKNVTISPTQINITQEENSQAIPFELDRFYDGVDLMNMTFRIYFINAEGKGSTSTPINVMYSDDKVRFYWLVDNLATAVKGNLRFEIWADGSNEKGKPYMWKTKPNKELNVLESLSSNGIIKPSDEWFTQFIRDMDQKVNQASQYASQAQTLVEEANDALDRVNESITNAQDQIADKVKEELSGTFYTKEEVDAIVDNMDFTEILDEVQGKIDAIDGLANLVVEYDTATNTMTFKNGDVVISSHVLNTNPTEEWTDAFKLIIQGDIDAAVGTVSSDLDAYKTSNDAAVSGVQAEVTSIKTDLDENYYTKTETDTKVSTDLNPVKTQLGTVESTANTNKINLAAMTTKIAEVEEKVNGIDTTPSVRYRTTYNNEDGKLTLLELEGESETPVSQHIIIGGGGGGPSTGSTVTIERITASPLTVTKEDRALIKYNFSSVDSSGDDTGEGTATWKVNNAVVATSIVLQGENTFDITQHVSVGTQKITLMIEDSAGTIGTKQWTVQVVDVRMESSFNDNFTYPIEPVNFDYIPYGAVDKTVHFILDGSEIGTVNTTSSGIPMSYSIPAQTHGAHLLESYITAQINNSNIETNHIYKDIIWYDDSSDVPVIGCVSQNITVKQYDSINIKYVVYDPKTETPQVTLTVDDEKSSVLTLTSPVNIWQFKSDEVGAHTLTIECRGTVKTINVTVEKLDIDVSPITANLAFDFNPSGKSNNDTDRLWFDGDVHMTVSDNFDWTNGGYQIDENGDQYFCIKAGTQAIIDYNLFADDARRNGKEFKLIFKSTNVRNANAQILSCVDGTASKVGIQMNVHEAYIHAGSESLNLTYSEEDIIEFEFNINKDTDDIPMIMGYEDGVGTEPLVYGESHNFTQVVPKMIMIGSDDCDVLIYRFKVYNAALTDRDILSNFIADARNAEEMIARYNRNQIYDENNQLTPEVLAEKCPDLRIIKIDAPWFTNDKKDKVTGTTIQQIYKNGDAILDNWTAYDCQHSGQGTSSNEYGQAGRNLDLIMNKSGVEGKKPRIVLGDGVTEVSKISLTRDSVPVNYLNCKVNIASCENQNNAKLQKRYNQFNPFIRTAKVNDSKVKDTMEFHNCVIFVRENNPDISTHREFNDCEYHFYAIGNVGDSKKTDSTRVNDSSDPLECILEIMDYNLPLSEFPTGNPDGSHIPVNPADWKSGNTIYDTLYADQFDEDGTYGWRYRVESDDPTEDANIVSTINQKWRDFYGFVVTSTDEDFHDRLGDYFVVDSALYYYLFTERYTMPDNRAKNSFWHYGKCEDSVYRWDLCFNYDNDTALGIDNVGKLVLPYGKEDTDYYIDGDPSSSYIYRAAESTFFCRLRDLFKTGMQQMFVNRESAGAWNASTLIKEFDDAQNQFPEELWRTDIERKYLRTYKEGATRFLTEMAHGRKKYQRRQFERNQELYMATKYFGTTATSDQIMMRFNNPVGAVVPQDFTLHITPYSNMYIGIKYGNVNPINFRAKAGIEYDIPYPIESGTADITLIYGASFIQAIGDLSKCYVGDNDFSKASKLQRLVIGSDTEGYSNSYLTQLKFGNNKLLEYLDIQNTKALSSVVDLSSCNNMKELYASGSGATGIIFANGGKIQIADLPAIGSIIAKNLEYLNNFNVASYNNMHTLTIENCDTIDVKDILEQSPNVTRVRITGIDWNLENANLLERIYKMSGIDKNGYNVPQSVLTGHVHVPVMREKLLADYRAAWSDLDITYDTLIQQYIVTFVNYDGTVLDVQYVDKGEKPVDPIKRAENPITTPTKQSSVSTDYTFSGWDSQLIPIFANLTITATYAESLRKYTVRYLSRGNVLLEETAPYGSTVLYSGDTPSYTAEESAYKYYLFTGWDKSGFVNGNKDINATYDSCEYNAGYFDGKDLSELCPVEIYAMTQVGIETQHITLKDALSFELGHDYSFNDIEESVIVDKQLRFTGDNYLDTGIALFDEDRDFVLAIDYAFDTSSAQSSVIAQCFQHDGVQGFRAWINGSPKISWGTSSSNLSSVEKREMLVIRHIKGENGIHIYTSNLSGNESLYVELSKTRPTLTSATLILGCGKADDGVYENYAVGSVFWSKIWYADLGDKACRNIAAWTHESMEFEVCGFKNYYLSENSSKRSSLTLLAKHLLSVNKQLSNSSVNTAGWAECKLNDYLNTRLFNALPIQWQQLIKQVKVNSSVGDKSMDVSPSDCYIFIPAVYEVDPSMTAEPYCYEGVPIPYLTTNESRICNYDNGEAHSYWLRSPNIAYASYFYRVEDTGSLSGYYYGYMEDGIRIMFSI